MSTVVAPMPAFGLSLSRPAFCSRRSARPLLDGSFWMPTLAPRGRSASDL
jgi:hypothetical protein